MTPHALPPHMAEPVLFPWRPTFVFYTSPPRESDEWHLMYNKRTSSERCNKRIKLDYLLEAGKHHSTKFWYVRLYLIMMLIHMTSWDLPEESPPQQYIFCGWRQRLFAAPFFLNSAVFCSASASCPSFPRIMQAIHCLFRMLIHRQYSFSDFLNSFSEEFKNQKVFLDSV